MISVVSNGQSLNIYDDKKLFGGGVRKRRKLAVSSTQTTSGKSRTSFLLLLVRSSVSTLLLWFKFQIREHGKHIDTSPCSRQPNTPGEGAVLTCRVLDPRHLLVILQLRFFNLPSILARYR